jgi:hypothetical protein
MLAIVCPSSRSAEPAYLRHHRRGATKVANRFVRHTNWPSPRGTSRTVAGVGRLLRRVWLRDVSNKAHQVGC